jgi:cyclopropane fatty-acyl-phospholipid synthase-like methyltransferase
MRIKKIQQGYNVAAEHYNQTRSQFSNDIYLEKLHSLLAPRSRLLDIGCGAGKPIDSFFIERGHKVHGVDLSEKMLELARKNVPKATYELKDMTELKFEDYQVDAVVSFYAIFHIPREKHFELMKKFYSFLPKGGLLLITMGSDDWVGSENDFHGAKMYWSQYDSKKNSELVSQAGFTIVIDEIDHSGNENHQVLLARK